MKKIITAWGMCALLFGYGCGERSEVASGKTLVKINNYKITEGDLNFLTQVNPRASLYLATPANKQQVLDGLVEKELLYQSAIKEGLNKLQDVKAQINYNTRELLAKARIDAAVETEAKKYYDSHGDEFEQVKISHILIRFKGHKKDEVLQIMEKVKSGVNGGEDFAKIAKEVSEDHLTKDRGGDLGFVLRNDPAMVRRGFTPLVNSAFSLKKSQISNPITTEEGVHLITVTEEARLKSFDEVRNAIGFRIREDVKKELLNTLKQKAKVEYYEK
jgi:parvulin-like peptidyl-prolyl isomerase